MEFEILDEIQMASSNIEAGSWIKIKKIAIEIIVRAIKKGWGVLLWEDAQK